MANQSLRELTAATTLASTDLLYAVVDPSGTPLDRSVTVAIAANAMRATNALFTGRSILQVSNTTTETSLTPSTATGSLTLAANYLTQAKTLRLLVAGTIQSTGTPTLRIRFKLGSTTYLDSGAVNAGADFANVMFRVEVNLSIWTAGASGTLAAQGILFYNATVVPFVATGWSALNTTTTEAALVTAQWSAAAAGNVLSISNYTLTAEN